MNQINNPILRGRFKSLTMLNWNGFFARKFDLDDLVTTLSGGNGAGKSTTMAAFVTALIPDLTLLHFRNTTEAGATSGSRDKGLFGKLKAGTCYAILESQNSRGELVLTGVCLNQVSTRDKKVALKTFSMLNLAQDFDLISFFTKRLDDSDKVKILDLNDIRDLSAQQNIEFKAYNSLIDYHAVMFEQGIIPKYLRTAVDRGKFYRLIEASLYGGISSAITKSLRNYLLPENLSVRKAFADMEAALRENRMTLSAIDLTSRESKIFKTLIEQATLYVSSDYMRVINTREAKIKQALNIRRLKNQQQQNIERKQYRQVELLKNINELEQQEQGLSQDYEAALENLNAVKNLDKTRAKLYAYREDIELLEGNLEEQRFVLEQSQEDVIIVEDDLEILGNNIEDARTKLADSQQILDVKQQRAWQYKQAQESKIRAEKVYGYQLDLAQVSSLLATQKAKLNEAEDKLNAAEQQQRMAKLSQQKKAQAIDLVEQLQDDLVENDDKTAVTATNILQKSQNLETKFKSLTYNVNNLDELTNNYTNLKTKLQQSQEFTNDLAKFSKETGFNFKNELDFEVFFEQLENQIFNLEDDLADKSYKLSALKEKDVANKQEIDKLHKQIPLWVKAIDGFNSFCDSAGQQFENSTQFLEYTTNILTLEREKALELDKLEAKKQRLSREISKLSEPSGADDPRISQIAQQLGGVLLSEIYDDLSIEDAPYFSALFGPARGAIVLKDLSDLDNTLADLEDCPEDLYFIQGDPTSFDGEFLTAKELNFGVIAHISDKQIRYSKYPKIPIFGRSSREKQLNLLELEFSDLNQQLANLSFDLEKLKRLSLTSKSLINDDLHYIFMPNPNDAMRGLERENNQIKDQVFDFSQQLEDIKFNLEAKRNNLAKAKKLNLRLVGVDLSPDLASRAEKLQQNLAVLQQNHAYLQRNNKKLATLFSLIPYLDGDNDEQTILEQYNSLEQQYNQAKNLVNALEDLARRLDHFSYADDADGEDLSAKIRDELNSYLAKAEQLKRSLQEKRSLRDKNYQVLTSLESTLEIKRQLLDELNTEINDLDLDVETNIEQAQQHLNDTLRKINQIREDLKHQQRSLNTLESEILILNKEYKNYIAENKNLRVEVVALKTGFAKVKGLISKHNLAKHLYKVEYSLFDVEKLRSISDKSLGALRSSVANNEYLSDSLRLSESSQKIENKILFFLSVYQHLRERIRQDILTTDDPIEAIEQMEVELARLNSELVGREQSLAISTQSMANIMRKTILREQNRIRALNQGLSNIEFGQVKSVRLVVNIKATHAMLLDALSGENQHDDLFKNQNLTFSEALAKLYGRINPHLDMGSRSEQNVGEMLLDYRNYLELDVEVFRAPEGWVKAQSGALSTGEAIGTGMSILLMVIQSFEDESKRIRSKDLLPCRLLFLDEAARLDAKSIATLFELCERLDMQLIIAAPENISPEKGTTYKLVRKIKGNQEFVHVVGLRGFA